jgi:hypothetical protein
MFHGLFFMFGPPLLLAQAVLPGGRNSGQKAQKGPQKKKLAERICGRILADFTKKWQKRGRRKFSKEVPYF